MVQYFINQEPMIVNYLKHKFYNLLTTMVVLFIFVLLVRFFLTFLGFGLYGLSRILIYFRLVRLHIIEVCTITYYIMAVI